jgi:hypothetical protein
VLKPVVTGRLLEAIRLNKKHLPKLSIYKLPLKLRFKLSKLLAIDLLELNTF